MVHFEQLLIMAAPSQSITMTCQFQSSQLYWNLKLSILTKSTFKVKATSDLAISIMLNFKAHLTLTIVLLED